MMNARWVLALVTMSLWACGGEGGRADSGQSGSGITALGTDSATMGVGTADDTGPKLDVPTVMDLLGEEECAAVDAQAELVPLPADIIFVVDNSGSMDYEAQQIQQEMNGFSNQIIGSGIDVHVVLVSSYPGQGNGICIPAPLGNGGCPGSDSNPPVFTHVDSQVGSTNAWAVLLDTHPQWAPALREDSSKHVVVVTDDESNMGWMDFDAQFRALDPSYEGYLHHSVVCHSNCPDAADIGTNYIELSMATGGVASDLCDQDFQAVFDVLSTEVIGGTELACEFPIPPPPDDMDFNPDQVNVEFDDGMGNVLQIGRVDSAADCPNVVDGWYYDDPVAPTLIVVCPQTCTKLQSSENGTVNIAFGCASQPAG